MNKIGIYYAYWTKKWDVDVVPYISKAADLGFDILEINTDALSDKPEQEWGRVEKASRENDIELTFSVGLRRETDIASKDPEVRKKGIEFLQHNIKMISRLGGESFSGILYGAWGAPFGSRKLDREGYFKRSTQSMKKVMETAEEYGVYCNVEAVNRFEHFLINTCEEAVEYVEEVNSPRCKIHLDTYHMNIEEDSFARSIKLAGDRLGLFHIGENNRKPPGQGGHLPWGEIFEALKDVGYERKIIMEPFLLPGGDIARDIALWRDLSQGVDLDREAKKALEFTKQHLT